MRERILFIAAIVLFVASVPLVYFFLFEKGLSVSTSDHDAPPTPVRLKAELLEEPIAKAVPVALSLNQLQGHVEVARANSDQWTTAEEGMVLRTMDRIRTGEDSSVALSMPGVFAVNMEADSEFLIRSLAENLFRFLLAEGVIDTDVMPANTRSIEVQAYESTASTQGARFKMHADRSGMVALGTRQGLVNLEAAGKVVQVAAGFMARVERGQAPEDPIRIPKQLLLKVSWPQKLDLASGKVVVAGTSHPGARVRVGGIVVQVDAKGKFQRVLSLPEGRHKVVVEAEDVGDNRMTSRSPTLTVDTRGDPFQIRTSPEMWNPKQP